MSSTLGCIAAVTVHSGCQSVSRKKAPPTAGDGTRRVRGILREAGRREPRGVAAGVTRQPEHRHRTDVPRSRRIRKHEPSTALALVALASEEAQRLGATRVNTLFVRLGDHSGLLAEALRFSSDLATEGTIAAGARLETLTAAQAI